MNSPTSGPGFSTIPPGYGLDNGENRQLGSRSQEKSGTFTQAAKAGGPSMEKDNNPGPVMGSLPPGYGVIGNKYAEFKGGDSALKEVENHINDASPHNFGGTTHHPIKEFESVEEKRREGYNT